VTLAKAWNNNNKNININNNINNYCN